MSEYLTKPEIILALKSLGLGLLIGGIFAVFKLKPPSPETISGILGIVGIFSGWWIITQILSN